MMVAGLLGLVTFFILIEARYFRNREPWTSASLVLLGRRRRDRRVRRGGFLLQAFHYAKYARTDQKR
jgi:hypothetical protein